jgi:DNA/RNA-binding domain of Phe-tRNA-synthetase-like protein
MLGSKLNQDLARGMRENRSVLEADPKMDRPSIENLRRQTGREAGAGKMCQICSRY